MLHPRLNQRSCTNILPVEDGPADLGSGGLGNLLRLADSVADSNERNCS